MRNAGSPSDGGAKRRTPAGQKARAVPAISPAEYNAFIDGLDLRSIRMVHARIEASRLPERSGLVPAVRAHEADYQNEEGGVRVTHSFVFTGTYPEENEPAVAVEVDFEVRYSAAGRMSDPIFAEFRRRNLPLNTWPYFREFLHAALARTGWPVYHLPVYKPTQAPLPPEAD